MITAFVIPDLKDFRAWQLSHYGERLVAARTAAEKSFLRRELFNLKKKSKPS